MAKTPRQRRSQAHTAHTLAAAEGGRLAAAKAIRRRAQVRRALVSAPVTRAARRLTAPLPAVPMRTRKALAASAPTAGILVAEGDSWFDYPFNDVLSMLEDEHGFDVESVAHLGDTVEGMAYGDGQFDAFVRRLEKILKRGDVPRAILISGGGNDIAGSEFTMLLNHVLSGLPPVNDDVVRGVVDVRMRNAYVFLISGLTEITRQYLNQPVPIILHGYDYPIPDGRGLLGGWGPLPGPWLQPGLLHKGHQNLATNKAILATLLDAFNLMLGSVSAMSSFGHVKYVDLRNTLSQGATYKNDWANELHPTKQGFRAVANKIAAAIS